ncbi:MAG: hypothetical protein HQM09_13040 [Candidatus Riflebacteria bacterium]|nr:hypothetical protein [Candidatus Riflebacteria bacterium]
MRNRKGYLLLGLLMVFSALMLSSTIAVLEQDPAVKRSGEEDLKQRIDTIRRAVDLYRKTHSTSDTRISDLNNFFKAGDAAGVVDFLASECYLSSHVSLDPVAAGSGGIVYPTWGVVTNLVNNGSFEHDDGTDYGVVNGVSYGVTGTWRGNFTASDSVPDGWQLIATGVQQCIGLIGPATYVASLWVYGSASMSIYSNDGNLLMPAVSGGQIAWKRRFGYFFTPSSLVASITIGTSGVSGTEARVDGVMLELWQPPSGADTALPVPSAWVDTVGIVAAVGSETQSKAIFGDLIDLTLDPPPATWWFEY